MLAELLSFFAHQPHYEKLRGAFWGVKYKHISWFIFHPIFIP
jgi:hypothetical protein